MMPLINERTARRLYEEGLGDQEIAKQMDHHYKSIARWRRRNHLKSNVGQGKRGPGKRRDKNV